MLAFKLIETLMSRGIVLDPIDIIHVQLSLDSYHWPIETMKLDFSNDDSMEAYKNYTDFFQWCVDQRRPILLDYSALKIYCLFEIDCSR